MASKRNPSQSDSDEFEYQYGCTVSFQLCQNILTIKIISKNDKKSTTFEVFDHKRLNEEFEVNSHGVGMAEVRPYGLETLL